MTPRLARHIKALTWELKVMPVRALHFAIAIIAAMTLSPNAWADGGWTTTAVNMRTCGSVRCPVILTVPARATVEVYHCNSWCSVSHAGRSGYMYARYIEYSGPVYRSLPGPILTPRVAPLYPGGPFGISQSSGYLVWPELSVVARP
jgi:hypothetical protein